MEKITQTIIVAGVVIKQDGKYLLVQEGRSNKKDCGLWNFPAGKVEEGNTIEETAIKEAKEESGYDVELLRKLDIFQDHANTPSKHAFEAKIVGGKLSWPEDEIMDAKWFTWQEIQDMKDKLREGWIIGAISIMENYFAKKERFKLIPSVYVLPIKDEKILLLRRFNTGFEDGKYALVAGHVDGGETMTQAMNREAREEAGIDFAEKDLELVLTMHRWCGDHERIDLFFVAKKWNGEIKNLEPNKCDDLSWFPLKQLPENMSPYIRVAIDCYLKGEKYCEFGWNK